MEEIEYAKSHENERIDGDDGTVRVNGAPSQQTYVERFVSQAVRRNYSAVLITALDIKDLTVVHESTLVKLLYELNRMSKSGLSLSSLDELTRTEIRKRGSTPQLKAKLLANFNRYRRSRK